MPLDNKGDAPIVYAFNCDSDDSLDCLIYFAQLYPDTLAYLYDNDRKPIQAVCDSPVCYSPYEKQTYLENVDHNSRIIIYKELNRIWFDSEQVGIE
jgi:hypothetical protein